jgi:hypothetical protein
MYYASKRRNLPIDPSDFFSHHFRHRNIIKNYLTTFIDDLAMEKETIRFAAAVVAGFIVMILIGFIFANIMQTIPLTGPFIGGIVAGLVAGKDYLNGGKAAVFAGLLGAVGVAFDVMANTAYFRMDVPQFPQVAGIFFLILAIIYFPFLAFLGGTVGGALRHL